MPALTLVLVVLHQHMQKFLMYLLPMQAFSCNEIRPFLSISQQTVKFLFEGSSFESRTKNVQNHVTDACSFFYKQLSSPFSPPG